MTERRRFMRFDTLIDAFYFLVGKDKRKSNSTVMDISREGARLISDKPLQKGIELELQMQIPGDNIPVYVSAEVAWTKKDEEEQAYKAGVKFKNIKAPDRARLLEYIYSKWLNGKELE